MLRLLRIQIARVAYWILRPEYSINYANEDYSTYQKLNFLYRLLVGLLWPIQKQESATESAVYRINLLSRTAPEVGQMLWVLNYLYNPSGDPAKRIYLGSAQETQIEFLYPEELTTAPAVYWDTYTTNSANMKYLYPVGQGPTPIPTSTDVIMIPASLEANAALYAQFLADLNFLLVKGGSYSIQTY